MNHSVYKNTIHQLIERQAYLAPESLAVSYNGIAISYRELNEKSNQLAHFLQKMNIKPETFVAISVHRSLNMIIGILGILKAGGVYIPIDPTYPPERINYMLMETNPSILLTQSSLLNQFTDYPRKKVIIDDELNTIDSFSKTNLTVPVDSDNLAYILYTSGSTGKPKGVMISHGNVVSAYHDWETVYQLTSQDIHFQMANFSFDVFTGDLIRALGSGGKLVLCPREILLEPQNLYSLMLSEKVNCAEFVPTVLRRLVDYVKHHNQPLDFMRLIISGSDTWSINEYRELQQLCGKKTRVINSYGLTETTIDSTYFEEVFDELKSSSLFAKINHVVPLGKPFPHTEIFILDENYCTVDHGTIGEIYIGGLGVARGYLNSPHLTAQRFIQHPFKSLSTAKLYKTGDQGRYLSNGNIEFLGRMDSQVKLRGMRIELNDIENTLNDHPAIRESIVVVSEDEAKHTRLVAYIVMESEAVADVTEIRRFLKGRLPYYMVPSLFIKLEFLPLMPNGKLDRKALNTTTLLLPNKDKGEEVCNPIELELMVIWKNLLALEVVNTTDHFFDVGGDSILYINLMNHIEKAFFIKIDCPFSHSITIAELASLIQKKMSLS